MLAFRSKPRPAAPLQRGLTCLAIVGAALALQAGLQRHLNAAGLVPPTPLQRPLSELSLTLGPWQGRDVPIDNPALRYGDDHLNRAYSARLNGQPLLLWMAYSGSGLDRVHHPEVCLAAAGQREDARSRTEISLPGGASAQLFRFTNPAGGRSQWVAYWYYTLTDPAKPSQLSWLQQRYQASRQRPSSLTVEVFAPELTHVTDTAVREFVARVDAALQPHLPPGAQRGSHRVPYLLINEGRVWPQPK